MQGEGSTGNGDEHSDFITHPNSRLVSVRSSANLVEMSRNVRKLPIT
jgi:hypothetical protein